MAGLESHWQVVDQATRLFSCEYEVPGAVASSFVFGLGNGELGICSPPATDDSSIYDPLDAHGKIAAIVAPNGLHYLGLGACIARYPDATVYASAGAAKRIRKKAADLRVTFQSLDQLKSRLPETVEVFVPPHLKMADTMARVKTADGYVWYVNDIIANMRTTTLPRNPIFRFLTKVTKSAPGFAVNRFVSMAMVKDKKAFGAWLLEQFQQYPPRAMVVGHGKPVDIEKLPERLNAMVRAAF